MAADLAYENGKAQIFSTIQTPWHGEGTILSEAPGFDEALALANFDYPLEKRPYFEPVDPANLGSGFQEAGTAFYVYRPDEGRNLGSVGEAYEVVTNREAFEVLRPLVDGGTLKLETGGVLRHGADAWMLGRWDVEKFGPVVQEVFQKDGGILPFATVMANHSGRRGILLGCTSVRVVCSNTLSAAETSAEGYEARRWRSVSHKWGAKDKLNEAAKEVLHGVVAEFEVIAKQYRLLMGTVLDSPAFDRLVLDVLAPDPARAPSSTRTPSWPSWWSSGPRRSGRSCGSCGLGGRAHGGPDGLVRPTGRRGSVGFPEGLVAQPGRVLADGLPPDGESVRDEEPHYGRSGELRTGGIDGTAQ
jgi:phage/plasmid-like protein (TIGR03299 family)